MQLVIIIDGSDSVNDLQFSRQQQFIEGIVNIFDAEVPSIRLGLMQVSQTQFITFINIAPLTYALRVAISLQTWSHCRTWPF